MTSPEALHGARAGYYMASVGGDTNIQDQCPVSSAIGQAKIPTRGVYVGVGGDLVVTLTNNPAASLPFFNIADGTLLPLQIHSVIASGTTATKLVFLW